MSVAHARVEKMNGKLKTAAAGPSKAATFVPLEEHWLESPMPRAALMTISPEIAAWVLAERNPHNRRLTPGLVERLAAALQAGRWAVNGETIIIDRDGMLRNGQHRLTACVATDIPLETWVIFGVDPAAFSTMDRGKGRNTADDLSILREKNVRLLSAVAAMVWREELGDVRRFDLQPSSAEAQDVLARHPGLRDAADWVAAKSVDKILHPRLAGYCFYRFATIDADAAVRFFDDLRAGAGLERGDAVLLLRNRLQDNKTSKSRLKVEEMLALVIKAWNYRRAGRPAFHLRWNGQDKEHAKGEPFPTIA